MDLSRMGQLYIVGGKGEKTHLAFLDPGVRYPAAFQVCLPNIPIFAFETCTAKREGDGCVAGERDLKAWDEHYAEVTCQTCLRRAREASPL